MTLVKKSWKRAHMERLSNKYYAIQKKKRRKYILKKILIAEN